METSKNAGGERFRGSSEIPLTADGVYKAKQLGQKIAAKGGLDAIVVSDLGRTLKTAEILSKATGAPIVEVTKGLHPWHLGRLEGQMVTPDKLALQNHLIGTEPDMKIPGQGPKSTEIGESFNDFKNRTGKYIQKLYDQHVRDPKKRIGAITHFRVLRLVQAALKNGTLDSTFDINPKDMEVGGKGDDPGSVHVIYKGGDGKPQLDRVDMGKIDSVPSGILLIRHESTPWNAGIHSGAQS